MRNKMRDEEVNVYYKEKGWHIKRVWEHEIREDFDKVVDELSDFIHEIKKSYIVH